MKEYLHGMGIPETNNAIMVSGFPKELIELIWKEEETKGFSYSFKKTTRNV